jgi:hypothetical protein
MKKKTVLKYNKYIFYLPAAFCSRWPCVALRALTGEKNKTIKNERTSACAGMVQYIFFCSAPAAIAEQ